MTASKSRARPATAAEPTGAQALATLLPRLAALPKKNLATIRADIGAAAIGAYGIAQRSRLPAMRKRFEGLAKIGEFDLADLEVFRTAALATQEVRRRADKALGKSSRAKLPADLVREATETEARMQANCEHTLANVREAAPELERLAPGTSYPDLAGDLEGYADLYDQHPDRVRLDGVNFRKDDPKLARALAARIREALSAELSKDEKDAIELLARGWTFLLGVYDAVAPAGRFLERKGEPMKAYPSLYALARPGGGRPRKDAKKGTAPGGEGATGPHPARDSR
jgi:hypothetical protein